jgi:hypothetical protein
MANTWQMKGEYFKACSCAPGCPCDFWAPPTHTLCEGIIAMRIIEGHFDAVPLKGLKWAAAYHWPGPLHLGNGTLQPYLDASASDAQRNAILTIMSGKAGGAWFEVVSSLVSKVHAPKFVPIQFEFSLQKRTGKCVLGTEVKAVAEPIKDVNNNDLHAQISLPNGIEYFSAEVALAKVLKSTGPIAFNRPNCHGSFSMVNQTNHGLKA